MLIIILYYFVFRLQVEFAKPSGRFDDRGGGGRGYGGGYRSDRSDRDRGRGGYVHYLHFHYIVFMQLYQNIDNIYSRFNN
jgi:hypothetical protein